MTVVRSQPLSIVVSVTCGPEILSIIERIHLSPVEILAVSVISLQRTGYWPNIEATASGALMSAAVFLIFKHINVCFLSR